MAVEFGARLTLRDNMAATLQRNLEIQRRFTQQVAQTGANIRALGNARANPTVNVNDNASEVLNTVREGVEEVGRARAMSRVEVDDAATAQAEKIERKIKEIGRFMASPVIMLMVNKEAQQNRTRTVSPAAIPSKANYRVKSKKHL